MKKLVITGATGFLGKHFLEHFSTAEKAKDFSLLALLRDSKKASQNILKNVDCVALSESAEILEKAVYNAPFFFHFAGKAHQGGDFASFKEANVDFALKMASLAEKAHVKNFIYFSSVAVFGEKTESTPFHVESLPAPRTPYGISKLRAEEALREFFQDKETRLVIVRPPLIYAPFAPGNIAQLRQMLEHHVPLPLKGLKNKRAVLTLDDFLSLCEGLTKGEQENSGLILPVSFHLSTPEIYQKLGKDLDIEAKMFETPPFLFKTLQKMPILGEKADKLTSNFEILSNWMPKTAEKEQE